jgi:purine-nucleoside/S-methyl-5'-thioadenosine phosphorylase / adenosine deaminase
VSENFGVAEKAACLEAKGIGHGFFGRRNATGGDFNMSISMTDSPRTVHQNRKAALNLAGLGGCVLATSRQVHGTKVRTIGSKADVYLPAEADGMVTATGGIALGILTADCVPVLFADGQAGVIGACHAGWRSAVGGIIENTVAAMEALGARRDRITGAIGPGISAGNYEVGPEWAAARRLDCPAASPFITTPTGGRAHFDLPGFVLFSMGAAGIDGPQRVGGCTFGQPDRYFSHRHAQTGSSAAGRQISIIGLAPAQ